MARIYLTGRMAIEGPQGLVDETELPGVQGRVALAFLVLARGPVSRDALAEAVWEGKDLPAGWDKALNPIISKLRAAFSRAGIDGKDALASGTGAIELRRHDEIGVDFERCVTAVDAAEGALRQADVSTAWANAAVASSIARRPFLAGVYGDWVVNKRQLLGELQYRSLEVLVDVWIERRDLRQAAGLADAMVSLDRLRERGYRRLIEVNGLAGDSAAAQRVFVRCQSALAELGVTPSEQTESALLKAGGRH
ncbi:MAG: AfsR/SARP family transcriptional regulator [Gaiellaceae bacterium]